MNLQEDRVFINASAIIKISILMRAYDLPLYMAKLYINFSYVKHAFMPFWSLGASIGIAVGGAIVLMGVVWFMWHYCCGGSGEVCLKVEAVA